MIKKLKFLLHTFCEDLDFDSDNVKIAADGFYWKNCK